MKLGLENLLSDPRNLDLLKGKRVALLGHPASVDQKLRHSLDLLAQHSGINLTCAFGPQHGMRGEKQDNMIETEDYLDPVHKIPVFSLYGEVRRPTDKMMSNFDVLLVDLQDIGTRIYTYVTTLRYLLEACAAHQKQLWVLDRPNPVGRPIEGTYLRPGWESFVGAGPLVMRHGLTMGELAQWFKKSLNLDVALKVISMSGYKPEEGPGYGWPMGTLTWVNPSPNAPNVNMARAFPGTVLLEGATISEGRGTTRPLEVMGAPDLDHEQVLAIMHKMNDNFVAASRNKSWLAGATLRHCYFQPTFHKHSGLLCNGIQIHAEAPLYAHAEFRPYRLMALYFKSVRHLKPDYPIWRTFHYEYEKDRLAIDLLTGGTQFREWVDNKSSTMDDLESVLVKDETAWKQERQEFLLY